MHPEDSTSTQSTSGPQESQAEVTHVERSDVLEERGEVSKRGSARTSPPIYEGGPVAAIAGNATEPRRLSRALKRLRSPSPLRQDISEDGIVAPDKRRKVAGKALHLLRRTHTSRPYVYVVHAAFAGFYNADT